MAHNNDVTIIHSEDAAAIRASAFRVGSKELHKILEGSACGNDHNNDIANAADHIFDAVRKKIDWDPENDIIIRTVIVYMIYIFLIEVGIENDSICKIWMKGRIVNSNLSVKISHIIEKYPEILKRGPLLEMSLMAYHQSSVLKNKDRGILFDGMHMVYAPYVSTILNADKSFLQYATWNPFYLGKIQSISESMVVV